MGAEPACVDAVVVAWRPDPAALQALLQRLLSQVRTVWLVDNTPAGEAEAAHVLPPWLRAEPGLRLLPQRANRGVASGFNIGIRAALAEGASHVLLSDQDSLPDESMVAQLLVAEQALRAGGITPAAVGPGFRNAVSGRPFRFQVLSGDGRRCEEVEAGPGRPPFEVAALISSGSLIRREVLQAVGLMREDFFIDYVDIEWCQRARAQGYASYACTRATLQHHLGDRPLRVWAGRWRTLAGYGPQRLYFQARNAVCLIRLPYIAPWYRRTRPRVLLGMLWAYAGFAPQRAASLRMLGLGLCDGLRGRMDRVPESRD